MSSNNERKREIFVANLKKQIGIPYKQKYHLPSSELFKSELFLDCCALIKLGVNTCPENVFEFNLKDFNQAQQQDVLPVEISASELQPGDLIFQKGIQNNQDKKALKHNLMHVEVQVGPDEQSIGARWNDGVVQIFPSQKFEPKSYRITDIIFKTINPWLEGVCKSQCVQHRWDGESASLNSLSNLNTRTKDRYSNQSIDQLKDRFKMSTGFFRDITCTTPQRNLVKVNQINLDVEIELNQFNSISQRNNNKNRENSSEDSLRKTLPNIFPNQKNNADNQKIIYQKIPVIINGNQNNKVNLIINDTTTNKKTKGQSKDFDYFPDYNNLQKIRESTKLTNNDFEIYRKLKEDRLKKMHQNNSWTPNLDQKTKFKLKDISKFEQIRKGDNSPNEILLNNNYYDKMINSLKHEEGEQNKVYSVFDLGSTKNVQLFPKKEKEENKFKKIYYQDKINKKFKSQKNNQKNQEEYNQIINQYSKDQVKVTSK